LDLRDGNQQEEQASANGDERAEAALFFSDDPEAASQGHERNAPAHLLIAQSSAASLTGLHATAQFWRGS